MNDVGEGLKPAIGTPLAKRFWYPALGYVAASVYNKTVHDEKGNKDLSIARGSKELAFQILASLCGPILLVNIGQNTLGKGLTSIGSLVGQIKKGQNPFASMTLDQVVTSGKNMAKTTGKGVLAAAKELPHDIWSTLKLAYKDITHPKETFNKVGKYLNKLGKKAQNMPTTLKKSYGKQKTHLQSRCVFMFFK